jgi:hypothetical protein
MEPADPRATGQPGIVACERLEPSKARLRSPLADGHPIELLPIDPDRPTVELPPLGGIIGALAWSLTPALPVLAYVDWPQAVLAGSAGLLLWTLGRHAARSDVAFADGFLRFRGDQAQLPGRREDDDVRWRWSGSAATGGREDGARPS